MESKQHLPTSRVAGISLKSGKKELVYTTIFEHFQSSDRWFLKELKLISIEDYKLDQELVAYINEMKPEKLIIDIPLTLPPCHGCLLLCPGLNNCGVPEVQTVRKITQELLEHDQKIHELGPKNYEHNRLAMELFDYSKNLFAKETIDPILSRSFKRKLKKGFIPYKNRPVDFWVWCRYHDVFLEIFKTSYESIGQISQIGQQRLFYLFRHFSKGTQLYESSPLFLCVELFRANLLVRYDLEKLSDIEFVTNARNKVVQAVLKHFDLFVYDNDMEVILKDARAFEAFLLGAIGIAAQQKKIQNIPDWCGITGEKFLVPLLS